MLIGILSGVFWAMDMVITAKAVNMTPFFVLLPLICASIHDSISAFFIMLKLIVTKKILLFFLDLKSNSVKFIILAAILGGPIGIVSYITSIYFIGPGLVGVITSLYPALGTFLAMIFLKEKRRVYQLISLAIALVAIVVLVYQHNIYEHHILLGTFFSFITMCAWSSEAIISSWALKKYPIYIINSLFIRQITSAIIMLLLLCFIPYISIDMYRDISYILTPIITMAAIVGSLSYFFYYHALQHIGASATMALNSTYSAFSVLFSYFLLGLVPSVMDIVLGIVIIVGGIVAAYDF